MNTTLRSTIQLLRFPFSFFLMPVFWFALSILPQVNWTNALLIFLILHLLVYPASNGYNSYMDRDTSPIGGVKNPMQPTPQLLRVTTSMNLLALALGFLVSGVFVAGIFFYIVASLAYSWRKIRLKKYPLLGYAVVIIFQGALAFFIVYYDASATPNPSVPVLGLIAAALLIGGFYPLTQIFQHEADKKDGVTTISYLLGYKGTFIFTGIVYAFAFTVLGRFYYLQNEMRSFYILQVCLLPVLVYFFIWFNKVIKDKKEASYSNTMRMNVLASLCSNVAFITLLIIKVVE